MVTDGNGLDPGDALDGAGPGASLAEDDDEPGVGRVGDGDAEWLVFADGDADGDGLGDCVARGVKSVGLDVVVGLGPGWTDPADGGFTQM